MHTSLCIFLSILIARVYSDLLELQNGLINGTVGKTKKGRLFQQFCSIPYAEPPIGKLRFKAPVPAASWSGIKDASKRPPKCIQYKKFFDFNSSIIGQEDCLYLNVFVPNDIFKPSGKSPVIVGIHGGGFIFGSGMDYTPDYFMDHDVVFVTFNYRLGILGFLGMNNDHLSGNFGLKDQSLALQWVKENIARFGGDPDSVTLIGESTGARSAHLHMFSPLTKGLFHGAIMQSGGAFSPLTHFNDGFGETAAAALLFTTGCFRQDYIKILKCLQRLPAEDLTKMGAQLQVKSPSVFKCIIESNVKNQPFLPQKPSKNTYLNNVPWITGINSGEGLMALKWLEKKGESLAKFITNDEHRVLSWVNARDLHVDEYDNDNNTLQKIIDFYFTSNDKRFDPASTIVEISTDSDFTHSLIKTALSSSDRQYVYFYDHKGSFSWYNFSNLNMSVGPGHADELPLLFRKENLKTKWTSEDKKVSETLVRFWVNFASFGDPNGLSTEKIWTPVETEDIEYLHIKSNALIMKKKSLRQKYDFWESLPNGWKYE